MRIAGAEMVGTHLGWMGQAAIPSSPRPFIPAMISTLTAGRRILLILRQISVQDPDWSS